MHITSKNDDSKGQLEGCELPRIVETILRLARATSTVGTEFHLDSNPNNALHVPEKVAAPVGLYNIEDSSKELGRISSWTLRKHIKQGTVSAVRIGRRLFLSQEEIRRIQQHGLPRLSA